jgi:hypothetical protein
MLDKLDKKWVGMLLGLVFPAFCFFCYWLFLNNQLNFPTGFIRYLRNGDMLQEVAIACIGANLLLFYFILNKKAYEISKGMMYASFAYVGLVLYISLL